VVNEAVRLVLAEAADDLEAFESRVRERSVPFNAFVRS
jgi:hypothetical protein